MIESVTLRNFKSFRDQQIPLERLTVLVGANASGKSTVLQAIEFAISRTSIGFRRPLSQVLAGANFDWLYTRGGSGDLSVTCSTAAGTFAVIATPPAGHFPPARIEHFGKAGWQVRLEPTEAGARQRLVASAGAAEYLKMNASALSKATYSDITPPQLGSDGAGLASVLAYLALSNPHEFKDLVAQMTALIPNLRGIRFTKATVFRMVSEEVRIGDDTLERQTKREFQGDTILFDFANAANISADTVSEGTLMLAGLLAVLFGPSRPDILLLDDIEHGLHPLAQKTLLEVLAKIMARFPNLQILATAHSPYLLDCLQPEQVRILTLDSEGYSVCGKLTDHPQFEKWKDEMAPGELWSLFGENWIAEGVAK
ncbi:MAG: AAA family ATPase [Planctomycetes bacterium]|nr:AAA family ATPase [Planctomycetota bacterium]